MVLTFGLMNICSSKLVETREVLWKPIRTEGFEKPRRNEVLDYSRRRGSVAFYLVYLYLLNIAAFIPKTHACIFPVPKK
jgi:hypothetical protein